MTGLRSQCVQAMHMDVFTSVLLHTPAHRWRPCQRSTCTRSSCRRCLHAPWQPVVVRGAMRWRCPRLALLSRSWMRAWRAAARTCGGTQASRSAPPSANTGVLFVCVCVSECAWAFSRNACPLCSACVGSRSACCFTHTPSQAAADIVARREARPQGGAAHAAHTRSRHSCTAAAPHPANPAPRRQPCRGRRHHRRHTAAGGGAGQLQQRATGGLGPVPAPAGLLQQLRKLP
jgi:hypothetical protein